MSDFDSLDVVSTPRMRGERLVEAHFPHLLALYRDPKVMATLGGVQTEAQIRVGFDANLAHWDKHGYGLWAFFDLDDGSFMGRGGLRSLMQDGVNEFEIAYAVPANKWGKGIATEIAALSAKVAFEQLGLGNVVAFTLPDNVASRKVMEKLHMTYERDIIHADMPHVLYRLTEEAYRSGG